MRTLMRISIPNETNKGRVTGDTIAPMMRDLTEKIRPEAAYFYPEHGHRSCVMVFDLKDPSDLPVILEPLFIELNAAVELFPAMNADELKRGLAKQMETSAVLRH